MKIGVDLLSICGKGGGFKRYAVQLLEALASHFIECTIFVNSRYSGEFYVQNTRFNKVSVYCLPKVHYIWNQAYFPISPITRQLDVLHSPVSIAPLKCSTRTIMTVHDLAFVKVPEAFKTTSLIYWRSLITCALHRVSHILTVSEATKRDIIELYKIPESKVTVVYPFSSFDPPIANLERMVAIKQKYGFSNRYILYVGALQPRKNLICLIEAFRIAKQRWEIPHKLVLVGHGGSYAKLILDKIHDLDLKQDIVLSGYVPDTELPLMYRGADVFVYPSLYEGFGYPVLEALACGAPVITSNVSSLPEVVGEAGLLVNPLNTEEIAQTIFKILSSATLRDELREKGFKRVTFFTKEKMAMSLLKVYHSL